jgi:hypothetical protein
MAETHPSPLPPGVETAIRTAIRNAVRAARTAKPGDLAKAEDYALALVERAWIVGRAQAEAEKAG